MYSSPKGARFGNDDTFATIPYSHVATIANDPDEAPGFVFTAGGPIYENHDLGYLAWHFGPEGQPPVVSGMDIAIVKEGRIATLYTLLTS